MDLRATSNFRPGNAAALEQRITAQMVAAITESVDEVRTLAIANAPKKSGTLAAGIISEVAIRGPIVYGTVASTAHHAAFVEFGTGLIGEANPHGELPTQGVPITGSWIYDYKRQNWQGMRAQPYLRPAFDYSQTFIRGAFTRRGFSYL